MTFVAPNLACGEARGGRIPCHGAVTDEQRSHRPNSAQPGGRQVFFAQTSLLAPYRSTAGYARRSRLVWAKNPLPRTSSYLCLRPLRFSSKILPIQFAKSNVVLMTGVIAGPGRACHVNVGAGKKIETKRAVS